MTDRSADYEHDRRRHQQDDLRAIEAWGKRREAAFWNMVKEDMCQECHGTGFADKGRPCEHP